MHVGFVGVGNMGALMLPHIIKGGHGVSAYDLAEGARDAAREMGAAVLGSSTEVAEAAEVVLTSLPTPKVVESVYLGPAGLLAGAKRDQVFVDLSSISAPVAQKVGAAFADEGWLIRK